MEWRQAAGDTGWIIYLTAEELVALHAEMRDLITDRYSDRLGDKAARPAGSRPVEAVLRMYPIVTGQGDE